jgi:hypothetical protein
MEVEGLPSAEKRQARLRLQSLDREIKELFRTLPAGPALARRWGELIQETKRLEGEMRSAGNQRTARGEPHATAE